MPDPTLSAIDRDSVGDVGGATVTLTGTNLTGATAVTFGGVAATSYVVVNSTTITAVVPAASSAVNPTPTGNPNKSTVNVVVSKTGSPDAPLTGKMSYYPSRTRSGGNTWALSDWDTLSLGSGSDPFNTVAATGDCVIQTVAAGFSHNGGTKCIQQTGHNTSENCALSLHNSGPGRDQTDIGGTDGAGATGRYSRWYIRIPQATKDSVLAGTGQIKLFLSRTSSTNFVVCAVGPKAHTGFEFVSANDNQNAHIADGPAITVDVWHEIQVYEFYDGTKGWAVIWYDGNVQGTHLPADPHIMGGNTKATRRGCDFGLVYTELNGTSPIVMWLDDVCVADGFIDPP